ncbi:unnamed protein product [Phyllotreta striolata]|uniref:Uncharacterized protein n=1 Tax=Phyllotreta striolata TaxID=444603 RepID=A0A9N9TUD0_PHYSR|nr:unnamed protein product [Phyllotreta striolata]
MHKKTERACNCENLLTVNKNIAEKLSLEEQRRGVMEAQIICFRDENFRLKLDNANLKLTVEKMHHHYTKIVGKLKEAVELTTEVFSMSSIPTNTNSIGQQTLTVHPHRVNGAVINNPTIKLARLNEMSESLPANENLNGNNSGSLSTTPQNDENGPNTSQPVANTSRTSTSPVHSGNKSLGSNGSLNSSNGSLKRLSTVIEESWRRSQSTGRSLGVPTSEGMILPTHGSFSDASSNSTITELPTIPTLIENQSASSSWNGSALHLEEPSTSKGNVKAETSRGKSITTSTPLVKRKKNRNGYSATKSNDTKESDSDSDSDNDRVEQSAGTGRSLIDTTVYSSSTSSGEWEEETTMSLKRKKRKSLKGSAGKVSKKSTVVTKKTKSLKVVLTRSTKVEESINRISSSSSTRSSKADTKENSSISSFTESVTSNESVTTSRPRRRAAPCSLKEPSLMKKMRRSK